MAPVQALPRGVGGIGEVGSKVWLAPWEEGITLWVEIRRKEDVLPHSGLCWLFT